jgi:hypothetical protein
MNVSYIVTINTYCKVRIKSPYRLLASSYVYPVGSCCDGKVLLLPAGKECSMGGCGAPEMGTLHSAITHHKAKRVFLLFAKGLLAVVRIAKK